MTALMALPSNDRLSGQIDCIVRYHFLQIAIHDGALVGAGRSPHRGQG